MMYVLLNVALFIVGITLSVMISDLWSQGRRLHTIVFTLLFAITMRYLSPYVTRSGVPSDVPCRNHVYWVSETRMRTGQPVACPHQSADVSASWATEGYVVTCRCPVVLP